jgi:O-antigen/teichoic acid export membrane protein
MPPGEPVDPEDVGLHPEDIDVVPGVPSELGKQVSRDVVIYTAGAVVANGILYLSVPIYTRVFEPAEYSKLAFVTTVSGMLAGILVLGGDTALARFWFQTKDLVERRRLTLTWIGFLAVFAALACLLLAPLAPAVASWTLGDAGSASLFLLALATLPIAQTSRMAAQVMRNEFRPVPFSATGVLLGVASLGAGLVAALGMDLGVAGIFAGILCGEAAVLLVRLWLTRSAYAGPFDRDVLSGLIRFGVPLVPVTVSYWIFTAADRVVVGKVAGLEQLGYYSVSVTVTLVFVVLVGAVSQAWLPRALHLYEEDQDQAAHALGRSLTYYVFGLGVLAAGAAALAPEVTTLLAGSAYAPAAQAIPLLCLSGVAYGTTSITASGMTMKHRNGRLAWIALAAAVANVVAAVALVPPFGIVGAAAASLLGYSLLTTSYLWVSQRLWRMHLEPRRLLVACALLLAVAIVATARRHDPFLVRVLLPVAFVGLSVAFGGLRPDERVTLRRLRARLAR